MAQAVPGLYLQRIRAQWLCLPAAGSWAELYKGRCVAHLQMELPASSGVWGWPCADPPHREIVPISVPWIIYSLKQSRWKHSLKTRQCSSGTPAALLWRSVRGKGGMQKTAGAHSHPHTDTSFTPQRIICSQRSGRGLWNNCFYTKICGFCTLAGDIGSDSFVQSAS